MTVDPRHAGAADLYRLLCDVVNPRPIALVSTLSAEGRANAAPYSFFNAVSASPPVLVVGAAAREGGGAKDTLANLRATGECVVNVVPHALVRRAVLASLPWPADASEFDAAGFTALASDVVAAFRIKESPVHLECKLRDVRDLGGPAGSALVLLDVWRVHLADDLLDARGRVEPQRLDLVGRLGARNYVRAAGEAVFAVRPPGRPLPIGYAALPHDLLASPVLTGDDLARLAGAATLPSPAEVAEARTRDTRIREAADERALHGYVRELIAAGHVEYALAVAMGVERP